MAQKILVVDAEPVVRTVISEILQRAGYDVTPTDSPEAAVVILKNDPPALVITNVSLPGMSGHDAMQVFKECCPDLPVLMVSGLPDVDVIREWEGQDGFSAFPKPFTAQQLKEKVREMLAQSSR